MPHETSSQVSYRINIYVFQPRGNLLLQFFEGTIFRCLTSSSKEAKISTPQKLVLL